MYGLASPSTSKCCNIPETPDRLPPRTAPRALWLVFCCTLPQSRQILKLSVGQGRLQRFARLTNTRHPVLAPQSGASGTSTPYFCYTACRYAASHETMPQPLDAGLFSTVYKYVIVSFAILVVFIKVSEIPNLDAIFGRERRLDSSSSLLSCSSFPSSIYREEERPRE